MTKRPRPDLNQVREAMRDRDERAEQPDEAPPPPDPPAEAGDEQDDGAA